MTPVVATPREPSGCRSSRRSAFAARRSNVGGIHDALIARPDPDIDESFSSSVLLAPRGAPFVEDVIGQLPGRPKKGLDAAYAPLQALLHDYAKAHGTPEAELDELFQYPRGRRRAYGIIRDDKGHDDHFHVRFE